MSSGKGTFSGHAAIRVTLGAVFSEKHTVFAATVIRFGSDEISLPGRNKIPPRGFGPRLDGESEFLN